jgi:LPS-assembly protein
LFKVLLIVTFVVVFTAASGFSAETSALPGKLQVRADSLTHEQRDDVITATGSVEMDWDGSKLYADIAKYYRARGVVSASGGVKLEKDGDIFVGESAELEIETKKGVVNKADIFIKTNNLHLKGERVVKSSDQDFSIQAGTLTTCDGKSPAWRFRVDDLNLTLDDFAVGRNAVFYVRDMPVFWLPVFVFPAKTERQSGFLFPTIGHSSKKGAFLELPFYWALSQSSDLTATPDLQSRRGTGFGLEYRYMGYNKGDGTDRGYLIYDRQQERFRGEIDLKQQVNFTDDTYLRADLNLTLDRDYFRDFGTTSGEYNKQYLESVAFVTHRSDDLLYTAGAIYNDDLYASDNQSTLQLLPFAAVSGTGRKLGSTPLFYSFAGNIVNFDRQQGDTGQRVQLSPRLTFPVHGGHHLSGSFWGGYNQRFYRSDSPGVENGWRERGLFEAGGALRTEFARVYELKLGDAERVKHQISPEISYSFTQRRDQSSLPFFDFDDRVLGGDLLTFSVLNSLIGRSSTGENVQYRDLLRFLASQGYQLSGDHRDLEVIVDQSRPFTDTRAMLELFPLPKWRFFSDNRFSPYSGNVTNASVGAEVGDPKGTRAFLDYHHAEKRLDYIEGRVTYSDLKPYTFSASGRYSFDKPGFLETLYSVEYKHQCWGLTFSYRDRIDNREFAVSFNLSGIGTFRLL